MNKILALTVGSIIFIAGSSFYLYAQRQNVIQTDFNNPEFSALAQKIDSLSDSIQKSNGDISRKLDQVLSNQDKIFQELDIIRIRASRSN